MRGQLHITAVLRYAGDVARPYYFFSYCFPLRQFLPFSPRTSQNRDTLAASVKDDSTMTEYYYKLACEN